MPLRKVPQISCGIFALTLVLTSIAGTSRAAEVSCNFMFGETYALGIEEVAGKEQLYISWSGSPSQETIFQIFSNDLTVNLDNSLLEKLDTQEPFFVSNHELGKIYIQGTDSGVAGQMIEVQDNVIKIWSGFCTVGFG